MELIASQIVQNPIHVMSISWDFPGGPVVKDSPCNAEDVVIPGQRTKIPLAVGKLSPSATTTEPEGHN